MADPQTFQWLALGGIGLALTFSLRPIAGVHRAWLLAAGLASGAAWVTGLVRLAYDVQLWPVVAVFAAVTVGLAFTSSWRAQRRADGA